MIIIQYGKFWPELNFLKHSIDSLNTNFSKNLSMLEMVFSTMSMGSGKKNYFGFTYQNKLI